MPVKLSKKAKRAAASASAPKAPAPSPAKVVAKAPKARKSGGVAVPSSTTMYLRCLIDPFSEPACRMPDLYGGKTVAFKLVNEYTVTSDAAGYAVFAAGNALQNAEQTWTVTAGSTGVLSSTSHPDYAALYTAYTWSRLVCFGAEVSYVGAAQTAAGGITAVLNPLAQDIDSKVVSTLFDDGTFSRAQDGMVAVSRPVQEPRFDATTSAGANSPTFPNITFVAAGLPFSTPVFRVRVTRHMEGLPTKASLMRSMAGDSVADMLALVAGANLGEKGNASSNTTPARSAAKQVASSAANAAIAAAAPYAVEGAGQLVKWAGDAAMAAWLL